MSGQEIPWQSGLRGVGSTQKFWSQTVSSVSNLELTTLLTGYLFLLMFIPSTLIFSPLGGAGTPAIVLSLAIFLWYIASWCVGTIAPSGAGRPIRIAMCAFAVAILCSFVAAMTRDITQVETLAADRGLITFVSWTGLVIVVSQSIASYEQLECILRRAVCMGSVVAAIGIFEFYSKINVISYVQIPGLSVNSAVSTSTMFRNGFVRPSSTAVQPIEFGVVMAMLLPFAFHQAFYSSQSSILRRWAPVVLISFAIPVAVSRSGVLAAAVALFCLVPAWNSRRKKGFLAACVVSLVPLHAVAPGLIGTLGNYFGGIFGSANSSASVVTRTSDYTRDWPYIAERPIFGRGFGTFISQLYAYTDNAYLHQLIECGVVGVLALLILFLAGIHCGAVGRKRAEDERRRDFGQALVGSIAAAAVASATFDSLGFPMFSGVLFLVLGVTGAYVGISTTEGRALSALHALSNAAD